MNLKSTEKDRRSRVYLFAIIIILFVFNAILIYNLVNKDNDLSVTEEKLENTENERMQLQQELENTELELEEYIGQNAALDSIIQSRDMELAVRASRIRSILSQSNLSKEQLEKARREIASLRQTISRYEDEIDSLSNENEFLRDANYAMKREIDAAKEVTKDLESRNRSLNEKVDLASKLQAENIFAGGIKIRWNDKEKETDKLNAADKIVVRFNLDNNEIAGKGDKTIYFKLMSPSKSTVHNEAAGSGTFKFRGEESLYTSKQVINFQNKNEKVEFVWDKSPAMIAGEYEVHLFCEDYQIGSSKFELR
jgi:cell division protein FtsB